MTPPGPIHRLLADDHARLESLLERATADPAHIESAAYAEFRKGLLRHIGMEEKILLPAAQRARGGEPLPAAARLRLDHGAIAALLVPTPTPAIVSALRAILGPHDEVEEGPDGVYAACERLLVADEGAVLAALRAAPAVPVAAHVDGPQIMAATRRALERAGYDLADYERDGSAGPP
jgi:hypothetical protein